MHIVSIARFLLANHQLQNLRNNQFLLLKELQHKLLKENEPVILGRSGRDTLNEMSEIKKLLRIEYNTAETKLWRVMFKDSVDRVMPKDLAEEGGTSEAESARICAIL